MGLLEALRMTTRVKGDKGLALQPLSGLARTGEHDTVSWRRGMSIVGTISIKSVDSTRSAFAKNLPMEMNRNTGTASLATSNSRCRISNRKIGMVVKVAEKEAVSGYDSGHGP